MRFGGGGGGGGDLFVFNDTLEGPRAPAVFDANPVTRGVAEGIHHRPMRV